jgi:RNA polymerase sigma-70 factor, ECF subfamily
MPDKIDPPERADPITGLLVRLREGNKEAEAELVPLVYNELHRLARRYMRGERQGHTLQTSALVNEAYMRLAGERDIAWKNRAHFFGVSAQIMRRILVDHARTRNAQKRGGPAQKISLENAFAYTPEQSWQILALHEALNKLAEWDPRQCRIVELRFFAGLDVDETAEVLGISPTTVKREFQLAKAWLYAELNKSLKTVDQESSP